MDISELTSDQNPRSREMSLCIISHNGYGAISGASSGFIGGVEWQTALTARWFVQRGYKVSFLTWDEGGPPEEIIDGVRVIKVCRQKAGLPGLRFFHPKWTGLYRAMRQANADVYYHNCGECVTGQIAFWCRRNGRKFVFSAASDADCNPKLPELKSQRERLLYRFGLKRADQVVVQTRTQQQNLWKHFRVKSAIISMPCPGQSERDFVQPNPKTRRILWIGRVCQVKRPDRFLDLAQRMPDAFFDLVGPLYDDLYGRDARTRAPEIANLTLHGAIPRDRVSGFYQRSALLCCTSEYEGFPNTFLEAWSHGLPIVSTFDPDGIIARENLGVVVKDVETMQHALHHLLQSPDQYAKISANVRSYYLRNHTVEAVFPQFEKILPKQLARSPKASSAKACQLKQDLKVAIVTSFPRDPESPHGGVEAVSVNLVYALAKRDGLDVHVVTTDRNCSAEEISEWAGAKIHRLPVRSSKMLMHAIGDGRRQVQEYLLKLKPDLVHAHDIYGLMVKGMKIPRVFTIHGFIHEDTLYAGERFSRLRSFLWRQIEISGWAEQPNIIAISPYVRERLRGIARGRIYDIDNPVSKEFFETKRNNTGVTVFTAGLICERKNTLGLLKAVHQLKNSGTSVQLNIAGKASNPEYNVRVQEFIHANNLNSNVNLLGSIRSTDVRRQLAVASVFALLSLEEGAPMVIAEAMAAGVPVVASNRCGMPYMIRHRDSGFLVDPKDERAVAQNLGFILSNPDNSAQMGSRARQIAMERFHPETVAQKTAMVYQDILEPKTLNPAFGGGESRV